MPPLFRSVRNFALALAVPLLACTAAGSEGESEGASAPTEVDRVRSLAFELWSAGDPAFGVYVPDERPREAPAGNTGRPAGPRPAPLYTVEGAQRLAANPLYDFLFLNLEGAYDLDAVRTLVAGLKTEAAPPKTLLVRIPPISSDGVDAAAERVREVLALGADGVVLPHIRSLDEAKTALGFFAAVGADVWSPANPEGRVAAMLMLEDPEAVSAAAQIADLGGYSLLACGIGSLTQALNGDREAAEAGNQAVLAEATRAGLADMITANDESIERRIGEGFLGLLMQGPTADDVIRKGRAAAGRGPS